MAKIDNASSSNFKIPNEGKNLINKNQDENFDSSNNYDSNPQKNYFSDKDKNNQNLHINGHSPKFTISIKDKNIVSSKELKSELKTLSNKNNQTKTIQKRNSLSSSFVYYKENKCISNFKKIYSSKQKYISIILLVYSIILFMLSFYDLTRQIQNKEGKYLLCNKIIFICEMAASGVIILFHVLYFFINISNSNSTIIFLIMSIIILIFTLIYVNTYVRQKVRLLEIILHVIFNLLLIMINILYLFMSYIMIKKNNKVQQNIEDIMNFSIRNEKMPDFGDKDKNKEHKNKGVVLVEEEIQNNNS